MLRDHVSSFWNFSVPNPMSGKQAVDSRGEVGSSKKRERSSCHRAVYIGQELQQCWVKALIMKKLAFQQQWANFPGRQGLFVQKVLLCLSWPHDGPASPLCQSKMGQEGQRRDRSCCSIYFSGLLLPCQTVNLFIFI